jgi:sugar phosphate isomerase/epimerase
MTDSRIAVCSWSLRPADDDALLATLAAVGVDAVQIALSPRVGPGGDGRAGLDRIRAAGVRIVSGMMALDGEDYSTLETIARTGGVRPDAAWPANRAHADAVAALAADAGIGLVTFHAGFIPEEHDDPERDRLLERLRTIAGLFAGRGVDLAFETGQETAETLADALDDLACPTVGVNFDPANMILYGKGDPVAALRRLAPRVRQIHIKDATPTAEPGTWGTEVPAGTGAVDWDAFFATATSIEPPVDFVIEREAGDDRADDVIAARDLVRRHLAPAVS